VLGIHFTDVPFWHLFQKPTDLSGAEKTFLAAADQWQQKEGAYAFIQGTRPQTLAPAPNDSPGLAAWIVEKFRAWSGDGNVETRFTKDELLANVTLYWVTGTIGSSFQPYHDFSRAGPLTWIGEKIMEWLGSSSVPARVRRVPQGPALRTPGLGRTLLQRGALDRDATGRTLRGDGGAALLADDIRAFFRPLRGDRWDRSATSPATGGPAWGEPGRPSGPPALLEAPARRAPSPPRAILRVGLAAPTGSTRAARSARASPPRRRRLARSVATQSSLSPASSRSHALARRCTLHRVGE